MVCPAAALPATYVDQLVQKSLQPHIKKFCPKDATERFKNAQVFRAWAGEGNRVIYLLLHKPNDIAGIIWFAKKKHSGAPGHTITFALRLYAEDKQQGWGQYLGKGLSVPFMMAAHADVERFFPGQRIWLDFDVQNHAAQRSYEKFGYHVISQTANRVVMGYDGEAYKEKHE